MGDIVKFTEEECIYLHNNGFTIHKEEFGFTNGADIGNDYDNNCGCASYHYSDGSSLRLVKDTFDDGTLYYDITLETKTKSGDYELRDEFFDTFEELRAYMEA